MENKLRESEMDWTKLGMRRGDEASDLIITVR
jgi:hypothetical protein